MQKPIALFLFVSVFSGSLDLYAATAESGPGATIFVAPCGNDAWSGTIREPNSAKTDGPFATLRRARDAMRKVEPNRTRSVLVCGGSYFFNESFCLGSEDSGTQEHRVVWQAVPGEEVRLVGGRSLPAEAFQPISDATVLARLDSAARSKVLQADLNALHIPVLEAFSVKFHGPSAAAELFFNDERMMLARWPNKGWATIAKIIESGSRPREGDRSGRPGVFQYSGERPARWNVEAGIWLHGYWCYDWFDEVIRVKAIDRRQHRITLAEPHLYGVWQGNPSSRRFRAINLLDELDRPGEYYIDCSKGILFFWPPAEMPGARIVLATLTAPVITLNNASYVDVRGFIVEASQGDGLVVNSGTANRIQACVVRNMHRMGIRVDGGANHCIEACNIHDTGTGGLLLAGGDRKTLTSAHHHAINNHIWRFSQQQLTLAPAIQFEGVGNRASRNLIHDAPHVAVLVDGNDHVFEYNIVHNVCTETDDCGALGKGRNPSCRGNIIRYNFWHHIGSPMGHGSAAIYFDDGDGGETVFGNVFFRCGQPGDGPFGAVFSHGGHDNLAENNVFIDCKRALGSFPWDDKLWKNTVDGGEDCDWQNRLLKEVDITKPPYTTRYPNLVGFMNPQPGQPRINRAVRNLMVRCANVQSGNWQVGLDENWGTDKDPGFVDAAKGNFRLRPDAEVFAKIPGFQPIPFEKIGLYTNDLRPTLPAAAWPGDSPELQTPDK